MARVRGDTDALSLSRAAKGARRASFTARAQKKELGERLLLPALKKMSSASVFYCCSASVTDHPFPRVDGETRVDDADSFTGQDDERLVLQDGFA